MGTATKEDGWITRITLENAQASSQSVREVFGKMFTDATYEGDLMAKAGVSYTIGREFNEQYGESYNGVQLMNGHQFPDGVGMAAYTMDSHNIQRLVIEKDGEKMVQRNGIL